jgi:hypothetical protein
LQALVSDWALAKKKETVLLLLLLFGGQLWRFGRFE